MRTRGIARTKKVTIDLPETPFDTQGSGHVKSRKPNGKDSAINKPAESTKKARLNPSSPPTRRSKSKASPPRRRLCFQKLKDELGVITSLEVWQKAAERARRAKRLMDKEEFKLDGMLSTRDKD